jgi:hypothetical protein
MTKQTNFYKTICLDVIAKCKISICLLFQCSYNIFIVFLYDLAHDKAVPYEKPFKYLHCCQNIKQLPSWRDFKPYKPLPMRN